MLLHDRSDSPDTPPIDSQSSTARLRTALINRSQSLTTVRAGDTVDALGIPVRTHFSLMAFFAGAVGAAILLMACAPFGTPLRQPIPIMFSLALIGCATLCLRVRRAKTIGLDNRVYHLAAIGYISGFTATLQFTGPLTGSMLAAIVIAPIAAAYFLPAIQAAPYMIATAVVVVVAMLGTGETNDLLRSVALSLELVAASLLVMLIKRNFTLATAANRSLSSIDPVTGASSWKRLERRLTEEMARGLGSEKAPGFALMIVDSGDLSASGDREIRAARDRALAAVGNAIRSVLTGADVLAHAGGGRFVVIAPAINNRSYEALTRALIEASAIARRRNLPNVDSGVAVGWVKGHPGEPSSELMRRAEAALREATLRDRAAQAIGPRSNGYVVHGDPPDDEHIVPMATQIADLKAMMLATRAAPTDPVVAATAFIWRAAGVIVLALTVSVTIIAAVGASTMQFDGWFISVALGALAYSPICWWLAGRDDQSKTTTHMLLISAVILGTTACALPYPKTAAGLVETFLMTVMFQAFLLPPRLAIPYATISLSLYGGFLANDGYSNTIARTLIMAITLAMVATLMALARRQTLQLAHENERLSGTDRLTGVANTRQLRATIQDEIERGAVTDDDFAVLLIDLDDFTEVNERFGKATGDELLIAVGDAITSSVRITDLVVRLGGDNFAVVAPGVDEDTAEDLAWRISWAIEHARRIICPDVIPSAAVGVAEWEYGETVDDLLGRVGAALEASKRGLGMHHKYHAWVQGEFG